MPTFPNGWDPEARGSRFTTRAALLIESGEYHDEELASFPSGAVARAVIEDRAGSWILEEIPDLGQGEPTDASTGRGAEGWAPAIEWTLQAAIGGVIGAAAWEVTRTSVRAARRLVHRLRSEKRVSFLISRGMAGLLALAHILENTQESEPLDIEFVWEPSILAGGYISELSYVGIEPWIISIINRPRTTRYLMAPTPDGQVVAHLAIPVGEFEALFLHLPPVPDD